MSLQLVDAGREALGVVLRPLLGDLFLINVDDFLDGPEAEVHIFANGNHLADRNGCSRQRLQGAR